MPNTNGKQQLALAGFEKKELFDEVPDPTTLGGMPVIAWLSAAGETVPAWWSQARDVELRKFWKQSDHLSGTVATLREMMTAIPFKVVAKNINIKSHVKLAAEYTHILNNRTESRSNFVTQGWQSGYGAFIEDYHTQDNGAFFAVEGPGTTIWQSFICHHFLLYFFILFS